MSVPVESTPIDRLRAICLSLPEATERLSHGEPTWFVRTVFVTSSDHHLDGTGDDAPDRDEIARIVTDAYRCVAPEKLAALLDG